LIFVTTWYGSLYLIVAFASSDGRLQDLECICSAAIEACLSRLPVDYVPNVLDIRRLSVEVLHNESKYTCLAIALLHTMQVEGFHQGKTYLQIIGMLPHVDAKDGDLAADDRVLVLGGHDA
jgi:hypothetical protein